MRVYMHAACDVDTQQRSCAKLPLVMHSKASTGLCVWIRGTMRMLSSSDYERGNLFFD